MGSIRVLLADDHTLVRKGLRSLLEKENGIEVVDEAENGAETLKKIEQAPPDVVVMDIGMPVLNGIETTRRIKKRYPEVKVLVLTMHAVDEYIMEILNAGASGYVLKKSAPSELITAIRTVHEGGSFLSPSICIKVVEEVRRKSGGDRKPAGYDSLTDREHEVLQLIAEGKTVREIAETLFISPKTVEVHRSNLMQKLGLRNTAEIVRYLLQKDSIDPMIK
jgi:DNA-binding NarL/FixJ family response regulator